MSKWRNAVITVLKKHSGNTMYYGDIANEIINNRLITTKSKYADQKAIVNKHLKDLLKEGTVALVSPGYYKLTTPPLAPSSYLVALRMSRALLRQLLVSTSSFTVHRERESHILPKSLQKKELHHSRNT